MSFTVKDTNICTSKCLKLSKTSGFTRTVQNCQPYISALYKFDMFQSEHFNNKEYTTTQGNRVPPIHVLLLSSFNLFDVSITDQLVNGESVTPLSPLDQKNIPPIHVSLLSYFNLFRCLNHRPTGQWGTKVSVDLIIHNVLFIYYYWALSTYCDPIVADQVEIIYITHSKYCKILKIVI